MLRPTPTTSSSKHGSGAADVTHTLRPLALHTPCSCPSTSGRISSTWSRHRSSSSSSSTPGRHRQSLLITSAGSGDMPGSSSSGGRPPNNGNSGSPRRSKPSGKARKPGMFEIKVMTPPPRSLGIYALPPNTHNGEEIEIDGQGYVVTSLVLKYKLVKGKYVRDHSRLEVQPTSRYFLNMMLDNLVRGTYMGPADYGQQD